MAKLDDLEAVRTVAAALSAFGTDEQERILRWAREKLGLVTPLSHPTEVRALHQPPVVSLPAEATAVPSVPSSSKNLKSFVEIKQPKSDVQFAATVAYFYRFEASPEQKKDEIDATVLQDACRLAGRARFKVPSMTLNNAKKQGLLDKGSEYGKFALNTVGENLVAMTLPGQSDGAVKSKRPKKPRKTKRIAEKK